MKKLKFKGISTNERFNLIKLEKDEFFLDNLQDFVTDIGIIKNKDRTKNYNNQKYDNYTFYSLFNEDEKNNWEIKKTKISDFGDGEILRYHNRAIEMLIIFLQNEIKIIYYANKRNRKKIVKALEKFVAF